MGRRTARGLQLGVFSERDSYSACCCYGFAGFQCGWLDLSFSVAGRSALELIAVVQCPLVLVSSRLSCGRGVLTTSAALTKDRKVATGNSDPARFGSPVLRLGYFALRVSMFVMSCMRLASSSVFST